MTMWRGRAYSLVLFGLVLIVTGLSEMAILPVWEQTCEVDGGGDGDDNDMNSDPSPLGIVHKCLSVKENNVIGSPFLYSRDDQANSLVCSY